MKFDLEFPEGLIRFAPKYVDHVGWACLLEYLYFLLLCLCLVLGVPVTKGGRDGAYS